MKKKICGLFILLGIYIMAFLLGLFTFNLLMDDLPLLLNIFISDIIATIFIWLCGVILNTASTYDPYWSIQTILIYISLLIHYQNFNLGNILLLIMISIWSIRLTYNFIRGFNDISYMDWRYKMLKEKTKSFYQIVNLLGICMVPTIIVYLCSIPSFLYVSNNKSFNFLDLIGLLVMLIGIVLELVSDAQMRKFKKMRTNNQEIINIGLWKYSRHPNYLGEILFWYGLSFVYILSNLSSWYLIGGAILNTLLFLFISIPMSEKHLREYKTNYDEYHKKTRMLLPFKK